MAVETAQARHRERQEERGREPAIGKVRLLGERPFDVFDGSERHAEIVWQRASGPNRAREPVGRLRPVEALELELLRLRRQAALRQP